MSRSRGSESRHRCSLGSDTGCAGSRSVTGGMCRVRGCFCNRMCCR